MAELGLPKPSAPDAPIRSDAVPVGDYRIQFPDRVVFRAGERIPLTWRSFEALQVLIEAKGEVVERATLFSRLWPGVVIGESSLNQAIAKLRRELGEPPEGGLIETVARRGYRLTKLPEPLTVAVEESAPVEASGLPASRSRPVVPRWLLAVLAAVVVLAAVTGLYAWPRYSRRAQARVLTENGFRLLEERSHNAFVAANKQFSEAIDLDPSLAPAYAGLAEVVARSVESTPNQSEDIARRSVAVDPLCPRCQAVLGWILMVRQWRFAEAAEHLDKAASLDGRDPQILLWHAQILACFGRFDQALREINRIERLDFKLPAAVAMREGIFYLSGTYEKAIAAGHEALGLKPNYTSAHEWLYRTHLMMHNIGDAMSARASMTADFMGLSPDLRYQEELRWMEAYRAGGERGLVDKLLGECAAQPALDHQRYERATWKMWIGDKEGAMEELEHLPEYRPFNVIYLKVDPVFAPLHQTARFQSLLTRIGFPKP